MGAFAEPRLELAHRPGIMYAAAGHGHSANEGYSKPLGNRVIKTGVSP